MEKDVMIAADEFCNHHNISFAFVSLLSQQGLIEMTTIEEHQFIPANRLQQLEKLVRLHYDLDINLEGIEAITYLLNRIENMQHEMIDLKNRLQFYER